LAAVIGNTFKVWNENSIKFEKNFDATVNAFSLSGDGKIILVGTGRLLRKFDISGEEMEIFTPIRTADVTHITFSPTSTEYPAGRYTAIAYSDNLIRVTDTESGRVFKEYNLQEQGNILSLKFFDQNTIVARLQKGNEKLLVTVDVQTGKTINSITNGVLALPNNITVTTEKDGVFLTRNGNSVGVLLTDGENFYFRYRDENDNYSVGGNTEAITTKGKLPF